MGRVRAWNVCLAALQAACLQLEEPARTAEAHPQLHVLTGDQARVRGNFLPGEMMTYAFQAQGGDVVYAAVITSGAVGDGDTVLTLLDANQNLIEEDDDNGWLVDLASNIAGAVIPGVGASTNSTARVAMKRTGAGRGCHVGAPVADDFSGRARGAGVHRMVATPSA
jgi:hypothetical protein